MPAWRRFWLSCDLCVMVLGFCRSSSPSEDQEALFADLEGVRAGGLFDHAHIIVVAVDRKAAEQGSLFRGQYGLAYYRSHTVRIQSQAIFEVIDVAVGDDQGLVVENGDIWTFDKCYFSLTLGNFQSINSEEFFTRRNLYS
jgi:hypothetical protein